MTAGIMLLNRRKFRARIHCECRDNRNIIRYVYETVISAARQLVVGI